MTELFDNDWMKGFQDEWNKDPELAGPLGKIGFRSVIAYGYPDEDKPRGVIRVEEGQVVDATEYDGRTLNWDLRASVDHWQKWFDKGVGMAGLGLAVSTGKLKFVVGDYAAMIKDPRMATPFVKSFGVMGRVR